MPLYVYEHDSDPGDACSERFEVLQQVKDDPVSRCPECGKPCHRVFSPFQPMKGTKSMLSPKNLDRLGFTQYKRAGDGHYEKTAGGGPRVIKGD
jgi:putative FmdB family regulatory protein